MHFLVSSSDVASAAEKSDYSGTYQAKQKSKRGGSPAPTLHVVQSNEAIEVTKIENDSRVTNRFPLDGSEVPYTSPSGKPGKGKAQFNDKELVFEYLVVTNPQPNTPVTIQVKERWRLSPDRKNLTIRFDVNFPGADPMVRGVVEDVVTPATEKYIRVDAP